MLQSLQLQAQVPLASLGCYHNSRESARIRARVHQCFSGIRVVEGARMRLRTQQPQARDLGRKAVNFVRLALIGMQNDG